MNNQHLGCCCFYIYCFCLLSKQVLATPVTIPPLSESNIVTIDTNERLSDSRRERDRLFTQKLLEAINGGYSVQIIGSGFFIRDATVINLKADGQFIEGSTSGYIFSPIPDDNKVTWKDAGLDNGKSLRSFPRISFDTHTKFVLSGSGNRIKGINFINVSFSLNSLNSLNFSRFLDNPGCIELAPEAESPEFVGLRLDCIYMGIYSRGPINGTLSVKGSFIQSQFYTALAYNLGGKTAETAAVKGRNLIAPTACACPPETPSETTTETPSETTSAPTDPQTPKNVYIFKTYLNSNSRVYHQSNVDLSGFGPLYSRGETDDSIITSGLFIRGANAVEVRKSLILSSKPGGGLHLKNVNDFLVVSTNLHGYYSKVVLEDSSGTFRGNTIASFGATVFSLAGNVTLNTDPRSSDGTINLKRVNIFPDSTGAKSSSCFSHTRGQPAMLTGSVYMLGKDHAIVHCGEEDPAINSALINFAASLQPGYPRSIYGLLYPDAFYDQLER